jgi:hypothetical protein
MQLELENVGGLEPWIARIRRYIYYILYFQFCLNILVFCCYVPTRNRNQHTLQNTSGVSSLKNCLLKYTWAFLSCNAFFRCYILYHKIINLSVYQEVLSSTPSRRHTSPEKVSHSPWMNKDIIILVDHASCAIVWTKSNQKKWWWKGEKPYNG